VRKVGGHRSHSRGSGETPFPTMQWQICWHTLQQMFCRSIVLAEVGLSPADNHDLHHHQNQTIPKRYCPGHLHRELEKNGNVETCIPGEGLGDLDWMSPTRCPTGTQAHLSSISPMCPLDPHKYWALFGDLPLSLAARIPASSITNAFNGSREMLRISTRLETSGCTYCTATWQGTLQTTAGRSS
jgi:hypothetical protein